MGDVADDVLAMEDRRWAAICANDGEALADLTAEGLVYTHASGKVDSKQSYLATINRGILRYTSVDLSDRRVSVIGATAAVIGEADVGFTVQGQERKPKVRYTAVWALEGARWSFAAYHSTYVQS